MDGDRKEGSVKIRIPTNLISGIRSVLNDSDYYSSASEDASSAPQRTGRMTKSEVESFSKWRERARTVGWIDLVFVGVQLLAIATSFTLVGLQTLWVPISDFLFDKQKFWDKFLESISGNLLSTPQGFVKQESWYYLWATWVFLALCLMITVARWIAVRDLIRSTETGVNASQTGLRKALGRATTWLQMAIAILVLDLALTCISSPFVIAALLQMAAIGVVYMYMEELQNAAAATGANEPEGNQGRRSSDPLAWDEKNANF